MTTTRDSRAQALNALAACLHAIRDDWDPPGIVAALRRIAENIPLPAVVIAAGRYVADERNLTPAHIADLGNHAWDTDGYPPCPIHGNSPRRISGECAHCWAERKGDDSGTPAPRKATPPPKPLRELVETQRQADQPATPASTTREPEAR